MKTNRKLGLNKESIKLLSVRELGTVGGGTWYSDDFPTQQCPPTLTVCCIPETDGCGSGTLSHMNVCDTVD